MTDLRKDKRAPASLKVKYKSGSVDEFVEQFGTDVSVGGIFIKTKKPIEIGALLKLELQLSNASPVIHGIGRVCWRREASPDPNLPAGMGIKFIKLDPESRTIVDRIVGVRGGKPSRFEQTDGAEIAPPSAPPAASDPAPSFLAPPAFPAKPAPKRDSASAPLPKPAAPLPKPAAAPLPKPAPATAYAPLPKPAPLPTPAPKPAQRVTPAPFPAQRVTPAPFPAPKPAQRVTPAPFPAPKPAQRVTPAPFPAPKPAVAAQQQPAPRPPAPRPAAPSASALLPPAPSAIAGGARRVTHAGAPAVAGLFADSQLVRGSSPEPAPGSGRTSFFPPAPENGAARSSVPPPRASAPGLPKAPSVKPVPRAEQTRQSGEFLATAFAEGGVAPTTRKPAGAEDELIDQLFADVMDGGAAHNSVRPPAASPVPAPLPAPVRTPAPPGNNVEDVFAELSEEEGLASGPPDPRTSSPGGRARASVPDRNSDSVDDLFAELNDAQRPARAASVRPPSAARRASLPEPDVLPTWEEPTNVLEEDLQGTTSIPPGAWPSQAPRVTSSVPPPPSTLTSHEPPAQHARGKSPLPWILLAALAVGGAGAYVYYQQTLAKQASAALEPEPGAKAPSPGAAQPEGQAAAPQAQGAAGAAAQAEDQAAAAPSEAAGPKVEVEISSVPRGADVHIDGKPAGVTPTHVKMVSGRQAKVTVTSPGYAAMTKSVTPGDNTEPLRFKLEELPFEVFVRSDPPGAELSFGGRTATAPGPLLLGHLDGGAQVSVGKDGYQRMTRPLRLEEFSEDNGVMRATIEVRLSPLPGAAARPSEPAARPSSRSSRRSRSSSQSPPPPAPAPPSEPSSGPTLSVTPSEAPADKPAAEPSAPEAPAPTPPAAEPEPAPEAPAEPPAP